jgi:hypothetical protein
MRIEAPEDTLLKIARDPNWLSQPQEVITNDLKSSGNESRHEWDAFFYEEKGGRLFDPVRKRNVVGTDGGEEVQKNINKKLEDWFLTHDSGIAVRISPGGGPWHYPSEQIEIYRITYVFPSLEKKLFCSFRQFHARFKNPEQIRQFIFPEVDEEKSILEVINWVEKISQTKIETDVREAKLRSDQAYHYTIMLKSGVDPRLVFQNMTQTGFLGKNAIACGGSNILTTSPFSHSEASTPAPAFTEVESWHAGVCRICGAQTLVGPCSICSSCETKL